MNISITPLSFVRQKETTASSNRTFAARPSYEYENLAPLKSDTVSFGAKTKKKAAIEEEEEFDKSKEKMSDNESKKIYRISYGVCMDINNESQQPYNKFLNNLKMGLKNAVESPTHPDNPILPGRAGIYGRVKRPTSIREKVPPRNLSKKQEVFQMGDIIATRVVLKSTSRKDFDIVFKELGKMVLSGKLNILEVENYRLTPEESYVSQKTLNAFERACRKAGQHPKFSNEPKKSGYTAVHMTVKLPDNKYTEIQIMGRDMEKVKDLEDFYYKKSQNKTLDDQYRPIDDMCKAILGRADKEGNFEKLDKFQNETLQRYINDSYKHAREIPPKSSKKRDLGKNYFLPIPYSLPQELGFANLYEMKEQCERSLMPIDVLKLAEEIRETQNTETRRKTSRKSKPAH